MKRTVVVAIVLVGVLSPTGAWAHKIYLKGISGPGAEAPVPPGAAISLQLDPVAVETALNVEVRAKIERLLGEAGYRVVAKEQSDYLLFYDFERETLVNRIKLEPLSGPRSGMSTTHVEGPYDLTVSLRLVAAQAYEADGMAAFTWAGGAALHTAHTESWRFTNIVLVAALDHFLEDTQKVLTINKRLYDRKATKLGP